MLEVSQFLAAKDPDYDPTVKFEDTQFILNPTVMKINDEGVNEALHYFEDVELRRHIEVRYAHRIINYEADPLDRVTITPFRAKECTQEDFSKSEETLEVFKFNMEKELSLYCPDIASHSGDLILEGTRMDHIQQIVEF